jgi:hypothetical protein
MSFDFMMSNILLESGFRYKGQSDDDNGDIRLKLRSLPMRFSLVLSAKVRGGVM